MAFDHVALGIVLPGVMTGVERGYLFLFRRRRRRWIAITGREPGNHQFGANIIDPDFDDNPAHRWHDATN